MNDDLNDHADSDFTQVMQGDGPLSMFERLKYVSRIMQSVPSSRPNPALVRAGEGSAPVVYLVKKDITVGRSNDCDFAIPSKKLSSSHFTVRKSHSGLWEIADLGSKNGTYLNGRQADTPQVLNWGDIVEAGGLAFVWLPPSITESAG